jgi:hypothetical protein
MTSRRVEPTIWPNDTLADTGAPLASAAAVARGHFETALRLTAIALLLRPMGSWFIQPVLLALAAMALISRRWLLSAPLWLTVALAVAVRIAQDWPLADNHIYLLSYWTLAIGLSLRAPDALATLAINSRRLVGLAFLFAVLWKVAWAPDFLDQRFFRVTLLTDPRFTDVTMLVGGLSADELDADQEALAALPHGAEWLDAPHLVEPTALRVFATVMTWGVVLLESAVALLMMLAHSIATRARHAALLMFCLVTYAMAPVAGFGWLLLVMGLAQVEPEQRWLGRTYVAAFLVVLFYAEVPWSSLLLDVIR